jgi:hypothetical protein
MAVAPAVGKGPLGIKRMSCSGVNLAPGIITVVAALLR